MVYDMETGEMTEKPPALGGIAEEEEDEAWDFTITILISAN